MNSVTYNRTTKIILKQNKNSDMQFPIHTAFRYVIVWTKRKLANHRIFSSWIKMKKNYQYTDKHVIVMLHVINIIHAEAILHSASFPYARAITTVLI